MLKKIYLYTLIFTLITPYLFASTYEGKIFDLDGDPNKVLYRFERTEKKENEKRIIEAKYFLEPNHELILLERVTYKDNQELFDLYEYFRYPTKEVATVEIKDKKIFFKYDENGKKTEEKESLEPNTVNREEVIGLVQKNWDKIMKGEKIKLRFIIPDMAKTIGFGIEKSEELNFEGTPSVKLEMFALSLFVSMAAGKTYFVFEKNPPHRLLEVVGRTPVQKKEGNNWKTIKKGRIVFSYPK
jgi:hypothetical protein